MSEREWKQKYAELYRMTTRYIKHLHKAEKDRDAARARVERLEGALRDIASGEFPGTGYCDGDCADFARAALEGKP